MFGSLAPQIGIVLGSGLGAVADAVANPVIVPFAEIPHFPQSTVEGHSGRIVAGLLGGCSRRWSCKAASISTRATRRTGHLPHARARRARHRAVVLTNAAGGIAEGYRMASSSRSATTST